MKKYNHAYTLAFTIENDNPDGEFTTQEVLLALSKRIAELTKAEQWDEAVGAPFDTYENEESSTPPMTADEIREVMDMIDLQRRVDVAILDREYREARFLEYERTLVR